MHRLATVLLAASMLLAAPAALLVSPAAAQPLFRVTNADGLVDELFDMMQAGPFEVYGVGLTFLGPLDPLDEDIAGIATFAQPPVNIELVSIADDFECSPIYSYVAEPGTITIHDSPTPPTPFCPDSYTNGTPLVQLDVYDMYLDIGEITCTTAYVAGTFEVTGGAWFDALSTDGVGWVGSFEGTADLELGLPEVCPISPNPIYARMTLISALFVGPGSTPVETASWGAVKARF